MFNIQEAVEAAAAVSADMNEAVSGGGTEFPVPAEGIVRLRLVGYVELGVHRDDRYDKNKEMVRLTFELSGPKHPPLEIGDKKVPQMISFEMAKSLNEKASFFKLFKRMNHTGEHKIMAQMLGKPFLGTIVHNVVGEGDKKRTYANLRNSDGYTIRPPYIQAMDEETGDIVNKPLPVDEAKSPLRCFLWDSPAQLKEMWDSLFIDGRYDDRKDEKTGEVTPGRSKNFLQDKIRSAVNFKGSALAELLGQGGEEPDLSAGGEVDKPARKDADKQAVADQKAGADADPLAGM